MFSKKFIIIITTLIFLSCVQIPQKKIEWKNNFINSQQLNPSSIKILTWNINKSKGSNWNAGLIKIEEKIINNKLDLLLIQEACMLNKNIVEFKNIFKQNNFGWYFSISFLSSVFGCGYAVKTGVFTASRVSPVKNGITLRSKNREFNLTPKVTLITEYKISSNNTLLLINSHLLNFQSIEDYKAQLDDIFNAVKLHRGPIIYAGDFNTRNKQRIELLDSFIYKLSLKKVFTSKNDNRTKDFLNHLYPLDHVFYRGLKINKSQIGDEDKKKISDHNSLLVEFSLIQN